MHCNITKAGEQEAFADIKEILCTAKSIFRPRFMQSHNYSHLYQLSEGKCSLISVSKHNCLHFLQHSYINHAPKTLPTLCQIQMSNFSVKEGVSLWKETLISSCFLLSYNVTQYRWHKCAQTDGKCIHVSINFIVQNRLEYKTHTLDCMVLL